MEEQKNKTKSRNSMKHKFILVYLLFLTLCGFSQNFNVSGLKLKYTQGENLNFSISNKSDSNLYFSSFTIEKFNKLDGEWYEQVYDILNQNCGEFLGKEGFFLNVGSVKKICWSPQKVNPSCFNYKKNSGKYRLVFKYNIKLTAGDKYYFKDFIIIKGKSPH